MTLSAEQFNKLVTRDEHEKLEKKVDRIDGNVKSMMNTLDHIAKKFDNHEIEHKANVAAHDRFEKRISSLESASA
jgi:hypothetical protein